MLNFSQLPKMEEITREAVLGKYNLKPKRRCFAERSSIKQESRLFSVNFSESIKPIFENQTELELPYDKEEESYCRKIESDKELENISLWEKDQGSRIFLRDCLSLSIALDMNSPNDKSGQHTKKTDSRTMIGELEYQAKYKKNEAATNKLVEIVAQEINKLPFYKDADLICSVPPTAPNKIDLPNSVALQVSAQIGKQDVTGSFSFGKKKEPIKDVGFDKRWNVWERAQLSFQNSHVKDKTIVLIDDKYQSGMTIQYVAMKLQQAGARQVYGLCFVKTRSDKGNVKGNR